MVNGLQARHTGWFWIDNAVIENYGHIIGAYGVAVYAALCKHANADRQCFPSITRLAKLLHCHPNTVRKALNSLKAAGLIDIQPRQDEQGDQTSHLYTLHPVSATPHQALPHEVLHQTEDGATPDKGSVLYHSNTNKTQPNNTHSNKIQDAPVENSIMAESSIPEQRPDPNPPVPSAPLPPRPSAELKDAFAVLCYNTPAAWNAQKLKATLSAGLRDLLAVEQALTVELMRQFYRYWQVYDWRGQKGQRPEPYQVAGSWLQFKAQHNVQAGSQPSGYEPPAEPVKHRVARPIRYPPPATSDAGRLSFPALTAPGLLVR